MKKLLIASVLMMMITLLPATARAHCDTMQGPVIADARLALSKGEITPVLKWVKAEHESELRRVFESTLRVRTAGPDARSLADQYFFETLVRLHRSGEGAPYTGLKTEPPEAVIQAADKALAEGSAEQLTRELTQHLAAGLASRFAHARAAREHAEHNVQAGREYVAAYVELMHYLEGVHQAIGGAGAHAEAAVAEHQH
ncbi:MAG: DUF6448 family protein [Terriglobales bacterium]